MKISGVYKITNTVTGDFYIGSSKDVKKRLAVHKCKSTWNRYQNSQLYLDMQKYGLDKFEFQVLEEVEAGSLKVTEQKFIELLNPTYNQMNAKGLNIERHKEYDKEYHKEYQKTEKGRKYQKEYRRQLCFYNGETITLNALRIRFKKLGIDHPMQEAKKYLIKR